MKANIFSSRGWMLLVVFGVSAQAQGIVAGSFVVRVPEKWAEGVLVERVPMQPLYTPEELKNLEAAAKAPKPAKAPQPPGARPEPDVPNVSAELKPSYENRPQHWAIRFPKLALPGAEFNPKDAGGDPVAPQILIHRTAEWGIVFRDGQADAGRSAKTIEDLRRTLEKQDPAGSPAYMDATLDFIAAKKELKFKGGRGFRVLAQWSIEPDLVRRERLHYLFFGLTDDHSCQVIATFPIDLPGLPEDDAPKAEHLGYSIERYDQLSKQFAQYEKDAVAWLEKNAPKATPSLAELDAMIESLVAQKWE